MLITQRKAIQMIHKETGLSQKSSAERVKKLLKVSDGKREKVYIQDVQQVVRIFRGPPRAPERRPNGIKPVSAKKIQRIRELCLIK